MKEKINKYYNDNKTLLKQLSFLLIAISLLSYYEYIITGYTCPDGISEGLTFYPNGDWHLACGRWFVRYFIKIMSNGIIVPLFVVLGYTIFIVCISMVLKSVFSFDRNVEVFIIGVQLLTTPAVTSQLMVPHVFMTFAASFLFAALFAFFVWKKKIYYCIPGVICITLMMGLYQSYISAAVTIILMLIAKDILDNRKWSEIIIDSIKAMATAGIGIALDIFIYTTELKTRGLKAAGRVADFSFNIIVDSFEKSFKKTYSYTYKYFFVMEKYGRNRIYELMLLVFALGLLALTVKLIRHEKVKGLIKASILIVLISLVPVALNAVYIIIPYFDVSLTMQSHYALIFVLFVLIFKYLDIKYRDFINVYLGFVGILAFTYLMTSNATQIAMKESYIAIHTQTSLILDDVYETEGYVPNETTIVFVGYPSEEYIHNKLDVYQYAIGLNANQAFWRGEDGVTTCREKYLMNYFGINAGHLTDDEFYTVTETQEFASMPIWPQKGSVRFIGDKIVVKLTEDDYPKRK